MSRKEQALVYRAVEGNDFNGIAQLVKNTWCAAMSAEGAQLTSRLETAHYLAESTWGEVAVLDTASASTDPHRVGAHSKNNQKILGVILVCEHGKPLLSRGWAKRENELIGIAQANPALAAESELELAGIRKELELSSEFKLSGALESAAEFKLLVVSPEAKGLGVGKRLFLDATQRVQSAGAQGFYLLTDEGCDVGFYDHMGLKLAQHKSTKIARPGTTRKDDFRMYLYTRRF